MEKNLGFPVFLTILNLAQIYMLLGRGGKWGAEKRTHARLKYFSIIGKSFWDRQNYGLDHGLNLLSNIIENS